MTSTEPLPAAILKRTAVVYVRQSTQSQVMTNLEGIRRFLIHVLPSGFHRIRHYGLLASGARAAAVARARELLAVTRPPDRPDRKAENRTEEPSRELRPCPCCGGRMLVIETFEHGRAPRSRLPSAFTVDTS